MRMVIRKLHLRRLGTEPDPPVETKTFYCFAHQETIDGMEAHAEAMARKYQITRRPQFVAAPIDGTWPRTDTSIPVVFVVDELTDAELVTAISAVPPEAQLLPVVPHYHTHERRRFTQAVHQANTRTDFKKCTFLWLWETPRKKLVPTIVFSLVKAVEFGEV